MKRNLMTVLLSIMLIININIVYAGEFTQKKNETVYVNLNEFGNVEQINIYNEYILNNQEQIVDYGHYENIQNLNTKLSPIKNDNGIIWNTKEIDRLSYIGKVSNNYSRNIPWMIDISYKINGVESNPNDILGKEGVIGITIKVLPNKDANKYYQNNYMLQITSNFDMTDYISIEAKDATEVMTGMTKTLMFIVLPGQEKSFDITIGSKDFQMQGFTFAMIPLQGDIFDAIVKIAKDKNDTQKAFDSLDKSLNVILNEMNSMSSGITNIIEGTKTLNLGTDKMYGLAEERNKSIQLIKTDLTQLSNLTNDTVNNIDKIKQHVGNINEMLKKVIKTNEGLIQNLIDVEKDLDEMADRLSDLPGDLKQVKTMLSDSISMLDAVKTMLQAQLAGNDFDTEDLIYNLESIGEKTKKISTIAGTKAAEAQAQGDTATANIYYSILDQAQGIGNSLTAIQSQLEDLHNQINQGGMASKDMISSINDVKDDLKNMISINNRLIEYSKDLPGYIYNIQDSLDNMIEQIETINNYGDIYLENKQDITDSLDNIKQILVKLQEIERTANRLVSNIESNLDILDNEIYNGTNNITNGMVEVLENTKNITKQSNNLKTSKDTIKSILKNRNEQLTNETTVFNIDPNAKVISFTSEENTSPQKVQILLKSKDIKHKNIDNINDIESNIDDVSIWDRVVSIFKKIYDRVISLFS